MTNLSLALPRSLPAVCQTAGVGPTLGMVLGVIMPLVSGLLFPTYVDSMPLFWQERSRLLELQYVLCELAIVGWAVGRGFTARNALAALPRDVHVALAVLSLAIVGSTALLATNRGDATLQSTIQFVHLYFAAAVYYLVRTDGRLVWPGFLRGLVIGLPILAGYIALRFCFPPPLSQIPGGKILWDFAVPGFISVRYLGIWVAAIAAALTVRHLFLDERKAHRVGTGIVLMLVLALMFWTGTRAAVLGVLAAVVTCTVLARRLPSVAALASGLVIALSALALAHIFSFDNPVFQLVTAGDGRDFATFSSGRTEIWLAAIQRWAQSPILGWGTGSLLWDVHLGWKHTQPHNALLQFALDWGLAGMLAALWLLGRALRSAGELAFANPVFLPPMAMITALLAMSMVDGALYYPRFVTILLVGFALLLAARPKRVDALPLATRF